MSSIPINIITRLGFSPLVPLLQREIINKTSDGRTPLHSALIFNHYRTAQKLLNCGADVNAFTKKSRLSTSEQTVLAFAIEAKKLDFIQLFLQNGADPLNVPDKQQYTPIEIAFRSKDLSLIKLFTQSENITNLEIAIGLADLKARCEDVELGYLGDENEKEVRKLADLYSQRKIAFNVLGLKDGFIFKGKEFHKEGYKAQIMQKQLAEAHKVYLRKIKKIEEFDQNDHQLIDFFDKNSNLDNHEEVVKNIQNGNLEGIITGFQGHVIQVVFFKGYVAVCNSCPDNPILDVYKIDPNLVTPQDVRDIAELKKKEKDSAEKKLFQILDKWHKKKDKLCDLFADPNIQNKRQKSGNCTAKSGNVAKRFIQIMQIFPETCLEPTVFYLQEIEKVITENKRQSAFRKLYTLDQIAKNGELSEEDKEWFQEALGRRLYVWLKSTNPHQSEGEMILNLINSPLSGFDRSAIGIFFEKHQQIINKLLDLKIKNSK